jgi:hypothetical protein
MMIMADNRLHLLLLLLPHPTVCMLCISGMWRIHVR